MDGSPVKNEVVPVRMFLGNNPGLTPTYRNVHNKFSVKYFLNLVIVDENNRRFFKQHEIVLWRKAPMRVLKSSIPEKKEGSNTNENDKEKKPEEKENNNEKQEEDETEENEQVITIVKQEEKEEEVKEEANTQKEEKETEEEEEEEKR